MDFLVVEIQYNCCGTLHMTQVVLIKYISNKLVLNGAPDKNLVPDHKILNP